VLCPATFPAEVPLRARDRLTHPGAAPGDAALAGAGARDSPANVVLVLVLRLLVDTSVWVASAKDVHGERPFAALRDAGA
jgi:hypothetical protein